MIKYCSKLVRGLGEAGSVFNKKRGINPLSDKKSKSKLFS